MKTKLNNFMSPLKRTVTTSEFNRFKSDWNMYKKGNQIPNDVALIHLYGLCDNEVQDDLHAKYSSGTDAKR